MFEVDLGKIKFKWRGAYNASTVYTTDDVVYHSGSSWVYVNAIGVAGQTPSVSNATYWDKMAQGSDLGAISNLDAGDMVYFDGANFQRVVNDQGSHASLVNRSGVPVFKPQGVIQTQYVKENFLMRVNSGNTCSALVWYPINQRYNNSAWVNSTFEPTITPKYASSKLKVELNLHVGWRAGSYHQFGRLQVSNDNGVTWYRPTDWTNQYSSTASRADHGAYVYTTNGATYSYQGEQVQLTMWLENLTANTPYRFRWEYMSQAAVGGIWLNGTDEYYNQNYSRASSSFFAVTEINNGD